MWGPVGEGLEDLVDLGVEIWLPGPPLTTEGRERKGNAVTAGRAGLGEAAQVNCLSLNVPRSKRIQGQCVRDYGCF